MRCRGAELADGSWVHRVRLLRDDGQQNHQRCKPWSPQMAGGGALPALLAHLSLCTDNVLVLDSPINQSALLRGERNFAPHIFTRHLHS
jgi:hypothetical protein